MASKKVKKKETSKKTTSSKKSDPKKPGGRKKGSKKNASPAKQFLRSETAKMDAAETTSTTHQQVDEFDTGSVASGKGSWIKPVAITFTVVFGLILLLVAVKIMFPGFGQVTTVTAPTPVVAPAPAVVTPAAPVVAPAPAVVTPAAPVVAPAPAVVTPPAAPLVAPAQYAPNGGPSYQQIQKWLAEGELSIGGNNLNVAETPFQQGAQVGMPQAGMVYSQSRGVWAQLPQDKNNPAKWIIPAPEYQDASGRDYDRYVSMFGVPQ